MEAMPNASRHMLLVLLGTQVLILHYHVTRDGVILEGFRISPLFLDLPDSQTP